jgi:Phosphodiester glycosidase
MSTTRRRATRDWAVVALVFLPAAVGCAPPDHPSGIAREIPAELVSHLMADTVRTLRVADGVWYHYLWSEKGPWGLHLTEVDLSDCAMRFTTLTADIVTRRRRSLAPLSEMAVASQAVVAVNGDFFLPEGISVGPEVHGGVVRRSRSRPGFAWGPSRGSWIGRVERLVDGALGIDGVVIDESTEVLGGRPQLMNGGIPVYDTTLADAFRNSRHPRTAIGVNADRTRLWLVVIDGRQDYSDGMTLEELRELFSLLGADRALNLDGGGSSTMVIGGRVVNHPSDLTGERAVVNGLGLMRDPSLCRAVDSTPDGRRARP